MAMLALAVFIGGAVCLLIAAVNLQRMWQTPPPRDDNHFTVTPPKQVRDPLTWVLFFGILAALCFCSAFLLVL